MTRETRFRSPARWLDALGYRTPLDRVYRHERPRCGARCRDGHPCQARAVADFETGCYVRNGRCRLHGGLSIGPRTREGKRCIAEAARRRAQQREVSHAPRL